MTNEQEPQNTEDGIRLPKLAAQLLEANVQWSSDLSDQVIENKDREIAEWKTAFAKLYDAIDIANKTVDSLRIERVLGTFAQKRDWSSPDVDSH